MAFAVEPESPVYAALLPIQLETVFCPEIAAEFTVLIVLVLEISFESWVLPAHVEHELATTDAFRFPTVIAEASDSETPVESPAEPNDVVTLFCPLIADELTVLEVDVIPISFEIDNPPLSPPPGLSAAATAAIANAIANAGTSISIFFIMCTPSFPVFSR